MQNINNPKNIDILNYISPQDIQEVQFRNKEDQEGNLNNKIHLTIVLKENSSRVKPDSIMIKSTNFSIICTANPVLDITDLENTWITLTPMYQNKLGQEFKFYLCGNNSIYIDKYHQLYSELYEQIEQIGQRYNIDFNNRTLILTDFIPDSILSLPTNINIQSTGISSIGRYDQNLRKVGDSYWGQYQPGTTFRGNNNNAYYVKGTSELISTADPLYETTLNIDFLLKLINLVPGVDSLIGIQTKDFIFEGQNHSRFSDRISTRVRLIFDADKGR